MSLTTFALVSMIAGVAGTIGLTIYAQIITKSGLVNVDMIRAVGGFYSRSYDRAKGIGLLVHFIAGILFSGLYIFFMLNVLQLNALTPTIITGIVMGFIHGFIFSFGMAILSGNHPLEKFRNVDFRTAMAHAIGHVVYGLLVGGVIGLLLSRGYFAAMNS